MRTKLLLMLFALLVMAGTSYAHDLEPLHVDGRYLKNPNGDIVTLHGYMTVLEPSFQSDDYRWDNYDMEAALVNKKAALDAVLESGWKMDYVRFKLDGYWCCDQLMNNGEEFKTFDFDRFKKYFEELFIPLIDYYHEKGIYTLLWPPHGVPGIIEVGDEFQQHILLLWDYVSSHPRIKNNPGVMFELANEPVSFNCQQGESYIDLDGYKANRSMVFKEVRDYWQPVVDKIRSHCDNIIYVPGLLCESDHSGFAEFPIEGENIGYAVHWYPGWWGKMRKDWEEHVFPIAYKAPIIITENAWAPYNNYLEGNAETSTSKFGEPLKSIVDELGNVSWNCYEPDEGYYYFVNSSSSSEKAVIANDPEACFKAMYQWWNEYEKTKVLSAKQLKASHVSFDDFPTTLSPGIRKLAKIKAQFTNGLFWDVSGDAEYTVSDESVITISNGVIRTWKEGNTNVSVKYTDGTGQTLSRQFSVSSTLFPLTADGFDPNLHMEGSFNEANSTFGSKECCMGGWTFNDGLDFSFYKYLVVQLNQAQQCWAKVRIWDDSDVGSDNEAWNDNAEDVGFPFNNATELVIDLQSLHKKNGEPMDLSHIYHVGIWINGEFGYVSIKRAFLSNDGILPASYTGNHVVAYADNKTIYYGDDIPELTYSVSGYDNVGTPTLSTTATKTSPVGTYDIMISGSADGVTYKPGKLTVVPAPLTITANDAVVGKGKDIPALTLNYDGLRNGETAAEALSEQPVVTTTATKDSPNGNYEITVSGGKSANYELAWHNGTLTITPDVTILLPADRTAKVETSTEAWNAWYVCSTEYAPAVTTADGRTAQMVERYEGTVVTTGKVMEQKVTGLESGEYTVVLCANAYYTDGRGFDSDLKEGATDIVELYANDVRQPMTAHIGTATSKNEIYTFKNVKVVDGNLTIGMEALKAGTNWHTLQIKSLTLTKQYSLSESFSMALADATKLLSQRMLSYTRNTLKQAMALEQTYANYYQLTDALQQASKSIDAQAYAARALEIMDNELLNATNVCTQEAEADYKQFFQRLKNAYNEERLSNNTASEIYNPYEGGGGLAFWKLLEFMMSAWEYNMSNTFYMQGAPYSVDWAAKADDGTGFNKPYIEYGLEEGKQKLVARTLKATMTDMEPGQYTVTARVRLRLMDGASGAPKGVTLQVCDGTAVNISGQRIGDTNEYLDCYTATGTVGSDGVLTIKFHVAADNNLSNLAFRDLWQEKGGPVTITANSVEIIYGDEVPALTYTSAGDAISGVPVLTTTATSISPAGTYPIVVEQGTVERKNVSYVAGTLTVKKAPLTITADNKTKKQGEAMPELTATYKGFKNDETAEVLTKQPTLSCTATAASAPGTYPITVKGATAQNYDISFVNGTLTVTDADAVMVTANSYTIEYGDALPEFAYTAEGAELNGKPRVSCSAKQGSPVGTYDIVITKGSVKNYNDTYVNGTLTITKAPLTVGVKDETITEGDAIPAFTLTYDGFKNNDTEASAFTKKPVASTTATSKSEAGTYPITVSGGEARNYALTYGQGTLVIEAPSVPKDVDLTDRVGTSQSDWNAGGVCATEYAPAITTSDGRQAQMMETYEETVETTGEMMYQVITGLENGDYAVELYANAQYTDGRGFDSNLTDGARKVVYVSANDRRCYVTAHIGTAVSRNSICTVYTQVKDGTLRLGLTAEEPGTNWHTLQIKKLTLLRHGTVIYADDKTREEGTANPQWTYTVSGTAVTGKPTLSCTAAMYASPGCYNINVSKGTLKSDQPIYLQPGVLTITVPVGVGQVLADEQSEPIYDLQGRRVDATVLRKGLYIRGGKVVVLGK